MPLTKEEKKILLRLARRAIEKKLLKAPDPADAVEEEALKSGALNEHRGLFVTLHNSGMLRGCIGVFTSDEPLYEKVQEMSVSAAFMDPRFPPLEAGELKSVEIEISVLSPLREIKDVNEIEVGRHGIYIIDGSARGVLLPQVAVEHGFDRETFLDQTCLKAGLAPGCWKRGARILVFEAEIFKED
ncbi:MAG: AmmeMemoRadiSam system protein A [Thermodesulfobacteriota bacterium]|nr:MAG: AmmeMemoRadiSam system protein A [Thermodesulfobacteriota bacterium]